jgi:alanine racemase
MTGLQRPPVSSLEVDCGAIAANMKAVRALVGAERTIFGVVKADAYGFGAEAIAPLLLANGADALAVEDLALALKIRRSGVEARILLYPCVLPDAAEAIVEARLTAVIGDLEWAHALSDAATGDLCDLFIQLDIAGRGSGVPPGEAAALIKTVSSIPNLRLTGLCAHTPSKTDLDDASDQLRLFTEIASAAADGGADIPIRLLAASSLIMGSPDAYLNAVDPGRMLYGIAAPGESPVALRPALKTLRTRLISVSDIAAQPPHGPPSATRVGQIPLGAADGLAVLAIEQVLVRGRKAPLSGRPALEHSNIDLSAIPLAKVGDEVVIIGSQGEERIEVAAIYDTCRCSPSSLASSISRRVTRVHLPPI